MSFYSGVNNILLENVKFKKQITEEKVEESLYRTEIIKRFLIPNLRKNVFSGEVIVIKELEVTFTATQNAGKGKGKLDIVVLELNNNSDLILHLFEVKTIINNSAGIGQLLVYYVNILENRNNSQELIKTKIIDIFEKHKTDFSSSFINVMEKVRKNQMSLFERLRLGVIDWYPSVEKSATIYHLNNLGVPINYYLPAYEKTLLHGEKWDRIMLVSNEQLSKTLFSKISYEKLTEFRKTLENRLAQFEVIELNKSKSKSNKIYSTSLRHKMVFPFEFLSIEVVVLHDFRTLKAILEIVVEKDNGRAQSQLNELKEKIKMKGHILDKNGEWKEWEYWEIKSLPQEYNTFTLIDKEEDISTVSNKLNIFAEKFAELIKP